jgi:hypothetical protein
MRKFVLLSIAVASLTSGCVIEEPPISVALDGYRVKGNGTLIELTLSVSSSVKSLIFYCSGLTPFDTLFLDDGKVKDGTVKYDVDSTFLLSCDYHDDIFVGTEEGTEVALPLSYSVINDSSLLTLYSKDTLFFNGDTVRTSGYVRMQRYSGGLYAPLPPDGYDTLLIAGSVDTLVVWQDYDRDGAMGYDDGDVFWVVLIGSDGARAITLNRKDDLMGYRGLDLCFRCTR